MSKCILSRFDPFTFGAVPALIEWDNNIPGWSTMLEQVKIAQELQQRIVGAVDEAP